MQSPSMPEFGKTSALGASSGNAGTVDPFLLNASANGSVSASGSPTKMFRSPRHSRNNSDALVQGMVARFDSMSIKDFRARDEVALRRADMAREMAELEGRKLKEEMKEKEDHVRRLKEDMRKMKREVEEGKERERKVVKRLDAVAVGSPLLRHSFRKNSLL